MEEKEKKFCCIPFSRMLLAFRWFTTQDESILIMPYLEVKQNKWRINHCPSCGADVRGVQITSEDIKKVIYES